MTSNPFKEQVLRAISTPGMTQEGAAWLAKALHPSDSVLPVNGIPTHDCVSTAALNYTTTFTIESPSTGIWDAHLRLCPNPLYFARYWTFDNASGANSGAIYNPSLGLSAAYSDFGANSRTYNTAAMAALANNVSKFRTTYASATVVLSSSATTNQGSLTCAQYPMRYVSGQCVQYNLGSPTAVGTVPTRGYPASVSLWPNSQQLQALPGAVTWEARKGVYTVLKLDGGMEEWHRPADTHLMIGYGATYGAESLTQINPANGFDYPSAASTQTTNDPPFGITGAWGFGAVTGTGATTAVALTGQRQLPPTQDSISHVTFTGLSPDASLVVTIRYGLEALVPPTSIYVGQVGAPMPYDPVALDTYSKYSREMLAGYPADYNAFGAIFSALKGVAQRVLPAVGRAAVQAIMPAPSAPPPDASIYQVSQPNRPSFMEPMPPAQRRRPRKKQQQQNQPQRRRSRRAR